MIATLSDATGQFEATAFDDEPSAALEAAAKASSCGLLTVELDRRPGEEAPRVTIKRFQPLEALARRARLQMTVRLADLASFAPISGILAGARAGNGTLRLLVPISQGREATLLVGRDFTLDAELAARLERTTGAGSVELAVQEGPRLALVG